AATTGAAGTALPAGSIVGAIAMSTGAKIGVTAALVLLAAGAWWIAARDDGRSETTSTSSALETATQRPPDTAPRERVPDATLAANSRPKPKPTSAPAASSEVLAVPLDAPIPAGKGSVAGVIRFKDGKPLANARLALWGSPQVV